MGSIDPGASGAGGGGGGGGSTPAGVDGEFQTKDGTALGASGVIISDSGLVMGAKEIALPPQTFLKVPADPANFIYLASGGLGSTGSTAVINSAGVTLSAVNLDTSTACSVAVNSTDGRATFSAPEVKFNSPPYAALTALDPLTATPSDCATLLNAILAAMQL